MPVCRFLIDFPLIKTEIWSEKTQNTIRPPQKLLELLFTVFFCNTSPVRAFQTVSQGMHVITVSQEPPDNGAPKERLTQYAHTNIWSGRQSWLPPSPAS